MSKNERIEEATTRVGEFLRQHKQRRGVDVSTIYTIYSDVDAGPAPLLVEDLETLLAEVEDLYAIRKR